jgi:hypothetical protein
MALRQGDKVSVVGVVKHTPDGGEKVFIRLPEYHSDIWIDQGFVTLVEPAFKIGDKCRWESLIPDCATILAVSNGHAWIDMGGGNYCTRLLTTIGRVDDAAEDAPAKSEEA